MKQVLTSARLWIDGYDLSGSANAVALQNTAPALDATVMTSLAQEFLGGLPHCSLSLEGFVEYGADSVNDILFNRVKVDGTLFTVAASPAEGSDAFAFAGILTSYVPSAQIGQMFVFSATAEG